jgi:hypothetical protein
MKKIAGSLDDAGVIIFLRIMRLFAATLSLMYPLSSASIRGKKD